MSVTRATIVVGGVLYVGLWVLALAGARSLIEPLAIPLVLVVLVAGGNWLSHYMGLPARSQRFRERNDEGDEQ